MEATTRMDNRKTAPARGLLRKNWILAVMSLSTFMIFLDGTVVNTALPSIARDLSATNSTLQWVVNSYSLMLAGLLLVGGAIGDRFGRRRTLAAGMAIFGIAAIGAALSTSSATLILFRGLQGVGAAAALPATLSIITDVFPRNERAKAIGIWTAVGAMGIVIGPALGGYLVDQFDWSAVFWLHIPVVALSIAGLQTFVPESKDRRRLPLDVPGAALVTAGLIALVYGIIQGGEAGWTSVEIIGAFTAAAALLAAFVLVERRAAAPMLPLHFFKRPDFTGPTLVLSLLFFAMIGVFFFLTQFFQLVQGRSALQAGLFIMPTAGAMMISAPIAGRLVNVVGPKYISIVASLIVMAGLFVFTFMEVDSSPLLPSLGLALFGFGAGMVMATLTDTIMASVPEGNSGVASAMNDMSRELGLALGIAVLGSVVSNLYRGNVTDALTGIAPDSIVQTVKESLGATGQAVQGLPTGLAATVTAAANESFINALTASMFVGAAFIGLALLSAILLVPRRMRDAQASYLEPGDMRRDPESAGQDVPSGLAPVPIEGD